MAPNKYDESERPSEWSDEHKEDQDRTVEIQGDRDKYSDEEAEKVRQEYLDKWGK